MSTDVVKIKPRSEGLDKPYVGTIIKVMSRGASKGGLPKDPLWHKNLRANPECEVQIKRRKMKMRAHTASAEERERLWPKLVAHYPDYASYQAWTDRVIPVVVLDRV